MWTYPILFVCFVPVNYQKYIFSKLKQSLILIEMNTFVTFIAMNFLLWKLLLFLLIFTNDWLWFFITVIIIYALLKSNIIFIIVLWLGKYAVSRCECLTIVCGWHSWVRLDYIFALFTRIWWRFESLIFDIDHPRHSFVRLCFCIDISIYHKLQNPFILSRILSAGL